MDKKEKAPAEEEEPDEIEMFKIRGKDLTGRNMAYDYFQDGYAPHISRRI